MRILLIVPDTPNHFVLEIGRDLGRALQEIGHEIREWRWPTGDQGLDEKRIEDLGSGLNWALAGSEPMLVSCYGKIIMAPVFQETVRRSLRASRHNDVPHFEYFMDDPWDALMLLDAMGPRSTMGLVERRFVQMAEAVRSSGIGTRPIQTSFVHFPQAGPEPRDGSPSASNRDIDYLFLGNLTPVPDAAAYAADRFGPGTHEASLFLHMIEEARPNEETAFETLRRMADPAHPLSLLTSIRLRSRLEHYFRQRRRAEVLQALADLPVTVAGPTPPTSIGFEHNFTFIDSPSNEAYGQLLSRAKVVLNVRPFFPETCHERVFYALANGAGVLTDHTDPLQTEPDAFGYFLGSHAPIQDVEDAARALLERVSRPGAPMREMQSVLRDRHSWRARFEALGSHFRVTGDFGGDGGVD